MAQRPVVANDTLRFGFGRVDKQPSGDTVYLHAVPPAGGSFCCYVERYFNKNLRAIYRGDTTPVVGVVVLRFVVDKLGKCTDVRIDTACSQPELAQEVARVANRMNILPLRPSTVKGRPMVSLVEMKVLFIEEDQPVPAGGLWPDITVVYYPIQH